MATSATAERAAAKASRQPIEEEGDPEIPQDISADAGNVAQDLLGTSLVEQGAPPPDCAGTSTITSETVSTTAQRIIKTASKEVRPKVATAAQQRLQVSPDLQGYQQVQLKQEDPNVSDQESKLLMEIQHYQKDSILLIRKLPFSVPGERNNTRLQDRCPISVYSSQGFRRSIRSISHMTFLKTPTFALFMLRGYMIMPKDIQLTR